MCGIAGIVSMDRGRAVAPERVVLGGRSMGGRMCSMAVAEGLPAAGLVLLSYPLHPPGKPDKLRVEHLHGDTAAARLPHQDCRVGVEPLFLRMRDVERFVEAVAPL